MEALDTAIIGSGPAGISAALNAIIRHKNYILFGSPVLSDKVQRSQKIDNYPGIANVTGAELNRRLFDHLETMGGAVTHKRITGIYKMEHDFALLADQEEFHAKTIILATGVEAMRPLPGERELLGHGVSYCATCDGNLYKGKTIAVLCDDPGLQEEVSYLAGLAGRIYYQPLFKGSTLTHSNLSRLTSAVSHVLGENRVTGIRLRNGEEMKVDGVFFLKQSVSPAILLHGLAMEDGRVTVNRKMETNIAGCFAAGDCTGAPYQIAKAIGEGNVALHSAIQYLAQVGKVKEDQR